MSARSLFVLFFSIYSLSPLLASAQTFSGAATNIPPTTKAIPKKQPTVTETALARLEAAYANGEIQSVHAVVLRRLLREIDTEISDIESTRTGPFSIIASLFTTKNRRLASELVLFNRIKNYPEPLQSSLIEVVNYLRNL